MSEYRAPAETSIGHVHLKVAHLERALVFYRDVLGFELVQQLPDGSAAFLSAGGYHHHIALNTWQSRGGTAPSPRRPDGALHMAMAAPLDLGALLELAE